MTEAERKRWWRMAAAVVAGSGLAVVGWIEFIHPAIAEPVPKLTVALNDQPAVEPGKWYRSSNASGQPADQAIEDLIRISGSQPQNQVATGPTVPSVIPNIQIPIPPQPDTYTAGLRSYDSGLVGAGSQLPSIPNSPPKPFPVIPPLAAEPIGAPATLGPPTASPAAPIIPVPIPTITNPANTGTGSGITPISNLTSSPPPLKFPDTNQPIIPVQADSNLPLRNEGITVKTENPSNGGWIQAFPSAPAELPVPGMGLPNIPAIPGSLPNLPSIPVANAGQTAGTLVDRPKATENSLPYSEKYTLTLPIPNSSKTFTSGDNTMLGSQKIAALAVMGGLFLAPAPDATAKDDKADIADLKAKLDTTNDKLTKIQEDLKKLTEMLNGRRDPQGFAIPTEPGIAAQLKALKDNLAIVEQGLNKLKETTASSSLRPNTATPVVPVLTGKGIVRIVNEYPIEISMVVNGTSYKVAPSQVRDVEVPTGEFSYQLIQAGTAPTHSFIKEKESVTLRIK